MTEIRSTRKHLRNMIAAVRPAMSTDEGRPNLLGVYLSTDGAIASDGHRIHVAGTPDPDALLFVPSKVLPVVSAALVGTGDAFMTRGPQTGDCRLYVYDPNVEIQWRAHKAFPGVLSQIIPARTKWTTFTRSVLLETLKAAPRMEHESHGAMFEPVSGGVRICIMDLDGNTAPKWERVYKCAWTFGRVWLNVKYLIDAIEATPPDSDRKIVFSADGPLAQAQIRTTPTAASVCGIMPMRIR